MLEWIPKADNNDEPFFGVDRAFAPVAKEGCCAEVPLGYIPSIQEMLSFPRHRPTGPRCWARQNGGRCRLPRGTWAIWTTTRFLSSRISRTCAPRSHAAHRRRCAVTDHPRARPLFSLLEALSAGPLTPVALGKKLRGVIVDWRNFLAEAEALGLVSWRSPLWKLSPFGAQYLARVKAGESVKLAFWDAPAKPKRRELSVGDEFAQARRRRCGKL